MFDLLCTLTSVQLDPQRLGRIANCNLSALDGPEILRLAEYHGVLPLVARNLIEHSCGLPSEIAASLRSAYEENLRRSLRFTAELVRISRHLEHQHLRAIPFKGPVLAQLAYGDPALRSYSDLDFLISSANFDRAKRALADLGYRPSAAIDQSVERLWLRTGYERSFDSAAGKNLVELQWALLPRFYAVNLRVEDLLARATQTSIAGCQLPCLSPEDSVLVLCLHAAKHLWARLIWLSDIAETLHDQSIDHSQVFTRARDLGITRILGVSFWLVKNVLGADLPKVADAIIASDSRVSVLGREFAQRLAHAATYDFDSTEYFRLFLKLREKPGDRLLYMWRLVWTPGPGDVAALRLPRALFPLYRGVRAFRLLRKLG